MKKSLFFALVALAMVGCSKSTYNGQAPEYNDGAIHFGTSYQKVTKAGGVEAAKLLNNNFVVVGTKGGTIGTPSSVVTTTVFDHYNVNWIVNSANTTESNTADWEYVNITPLHTYATANGITEQAIKYWDFSAGQYDFIAYSGGNATMNYTSKTDGQLYVTPITPSTATTSAYTVAGATADLGKFYIADLVTVPNAQFGNTVQISFRNITAKVRVGLYEDVPGYSIRDVEFYESDDASIRYVAADPQPTSGTMENYYQQDGTPYTSSDNYDSNVTYYVPESDVTTITTLYSQSDNIYTDGTYTVYYPTVNDNTDSDNNKAHVSFAASASGAASTSTFATLNYTNAKSLEGSAGSKTSKNYLGEASNAATYCTTTPAKDYFTVLPNETATALTLRMNYTLVSNDGSNETIKVWGAKAVIPAQYCQWKSNYAYTYLFKISDNTNGQTRGLNLGTAGLVPVTFDAVTINAEDGVQETVTTVATPSITTYSPDPMVQPSAMNEYKNGSDIYVMVQDGASILSLTGKGQLYTVTGATAKVPATEANVMDALNMNDGATPLVGRNGLTLTTQTSDATITAIPGADGNNITVTAGQAAKFTGATGTYAYVYTVSDAADTEYYASIGFAADATKPDGFPTGYYKDNAGTAAADADWNNTNAQTFYMKYTNNNTTYAVKVIKVVD